MSDAERKDDAASFKVIDRRRFAADGTERDIETEEVRTVPQPEPAASPRSARPQPAAVSSQAAPPSEGSFEAQLGMPTGEPYEHEHSELLEPSFSTLVLSLSTQALMFLGEIPEGPEKVAERDLEAARNIIDLLGVLQRKTAGNLDASESSLLERILYDLRMRFVELARK
jgi:hypothetical protein